MKRMTAFALIPMLVVTLLLSACGQVALISPSVYQPTESTQTGTDLNKADDYDALFKLIAKAQANATAQNRYFPAADRDGLLVRSNAQQAETGDSSKGDFSRTNIQVEGVDEADIIKTDGRYLFLVANNRLYVVDTQAANGLRVVSEQRFNPYDEKDQRITMESPLELFLDQEQQRLILIVSGSVSERYIPEPDPDEPKPDPDETKPESDPDETKPDPDEAGETSGAAGATEASQGDSTRTAAADQVVAESSVDKSSMDRIWYPFINTRSYTTTLVYDISNPANPSLIRRFTQDGYYATARRVGHSLYVVTNRYEYRLYDVALKDYRPEEILPATSEDPQSGAWQALPADRITILPDGDLGNQTIIAALDTRSDERKPDVQSLIGSSGSVYSSSNYLYVAAWRYERQKDGESGQSETDLYRFKLGDATVREAGKGTVPGWIINQFSMDEHNGYFRIATTTGDAWTGSGNPSKNNLYVLDGSLKQVGQVTGLAPGETIKSVRFMGDKAYLVTFEMVDPLFVIDLTDPRKPQVLGELKIPGYSTYLHPYDENLLLGFGYDVMAEGERLFHLGMKVSLFDVSDLTNPQEVSTILLGGSGSYAEVLYNHKNLLFSREKNLIAFPASLTPAAGKQQNAGYPSFQGLLVLGLDDQGQLVFRGSVSHSDKLKDPFGPAVRLTEKDYQAVYGYDALYRAAYIGNTLYTFSGRQVRATDLDGFKAMDQVELPGYDDTVFYGYYRGMDRVG